jgi:dihydropteroate synthase
MNFSLNKTYLMGVLNVTPDSFSDGGRYSGSTDQAVAHAKQLAAEGADIIDIGGESTRPGAAAVSPEEELVRVLPVVERLCNEVEVPLSIDTYKPLVADRCLKAGAEMINDVTGLANPDMRVVAAQHAVPVVVMHMQGKPQTMQANPQYGDVVAEIKRFFEERIALARATGVTNLILDPGIGFGKTLEHNLALLL